MVNQNGTNGLSAVQQREKLLAELQPAYQKDPSAYYTMFGQTKVPFVPAQGPFTPGTAGMAGTYDLSQFPALQETGLDKNIGQKMSPALSTFMQQWAGIAPDPIPADFGGGIATEDTTIVSDPKLGPSDKPSDQAEIPPDLIAKNNQASNEAKAEADQFAQMFATGGEGPQADKIGKQLAGIAPSILQSASQGTLGATERNQLLQAELSIIEEMRELQAETGMASLAMMQMQEAGGDISIELAAASQEETEGEAPQSWFTKNQKTLLKAFQNQAQLAALGDKLTALTNFRNRALALNEQQIATQPFAQGQALTGLLQQLFPGQEFPGLAGPGALGRSTVGALLPLLFREAGTRQQRMQEEEQRSAAASFLQQNFPNMPGAGALAAFPSLVPELFGRQEARRQTSIFEEARKPLASALTGLFPGIEGVGAFAAAPELVPQLFGRQQDVQQQQALSALTQQIAPGLGPQAAQAGGFMPDLLSTLLQQALQGGIQRAPLATTYR